jgi:hypothetical protein
MNQGRDFRDRRDFKAALGRFQAADAIMHVPTTGLEVARTQVSLGLLVEARETLHRVSELAPKPTDPPPFREARSEAERLNDELEGRIGAIRFDVRLAGNDPPPAIFVDGVRIQDAAQNVPFRVNPGNHAVVARSQSGEIGKQVNARERETSTVVLDFTQASASSTSPTPSAEATAGGGGSSSLWRTMGYVGLGVGAVGVGVGAVTGLVAISSKHEAESRCVGYKCPPETWSDVDKMQTFARISTVSFVVGALGVAGGVGCLVLSPKEGGAPAQGGVRVVPSANGVVVVGKF